jgi:mRNA-degrading endonuclease HigB of HigAB toxin-antitoxin module
MRILSRSTLRDFWESHPDVEEALRTWYYEAAHADWQSPAELVIPNQLEIGTDSAFMMNGY